MSSGPKVSTKRQRDHALLLVSSQSSGFKILQPSNVTPLMAVYVVAALEPKKQSIVRCAGSVGVDIYEEITKQGLAGSHLEFPYDMDGNDSHQQHVPLSVQGSLSGSTLDEGDTLILCPAQMGDISKRRDICTCVTRVQLCGFDSVTATCNSFLAGCTSLTAIDMSPLRNVTSIGLSFMQGTSLTAINLCPLRNVTIVPHRFLASCSSLKSLDMSPLSNVTSINSFFMIGCKSLTEINMSPFLNIRSVGSFFLASCSSLTTIDMGVFENITSIDSFFMKDCTSLTTIDMGALKHVKSIGSFFMKSCTSIKTIDLRALVCLVVVECGFMSNCTSLKDAFLPPIEGASEVAGSGMFEGCTSLSLEKQDTTTRAWVASSNDDD